MIASQSSLFRVIAIPSKVVGGKDDLAVRLTGKYIIVFFRMFRSMERLRQLPSE